MNFATNLVVLLIFAEAWFHSNAENITAIVITPSFSYTPEDGVQFLLNKKSNPVQSFSICLRVSFNPWSSYANLIYTDQFYINLSDLRSGTGYFYYGMSNSMPDEMTSTNFLWKHSMSVLSSIWNSFCITFDATLRTVAITINGQVVKNFILERPLGNFSSSVTVGEWMNTGGVLVTYFNVWSKALSTQEVQDFSAGKENDFIAKSKPDLFNWKNQSNGINLISNTTRLIKIDAETVMVKNAMFQKSEFFELNQYPFDQAQHVCRRLNGKMVHPSYSKDHHPLALRNLNKLTLQVCFNKFWVPVRKSPTHPSKWITADKQEPNKDVFLEPWGKKDNQQPGDCVYFNTLTKSYYESDCNEYICSFCEMEHERFIFSLKSECPWDTFAVVTSYILHPAPISSYSNQSHGSHFSGDINSYSISNHQNTHWRLLIKKSHFQNETLLAEHLFGYGGQVADIIGLETWKVRQCGNKDEAHLKLTNVS